ncbi:MAG: apolipoprotein N-acyltransferase [Alphaproteobacteria bacterium]|nr:apolipoprotein N-acyltransferase [Alphaproteobacteria bacterium]
MKKIKALWISNFSLFVWGILSSFAFAPYFIFPLMWCGLALIFYRLNSQSRWRGVLGAFCFGFGLGAAGMHWLSHAMLLDDGQYAWMIPIIWIGFGLFFGLYYAATAFCASFSPKGIRRWLAFAGWFCVFEWVRSWFATGFPWNVMGNIWNGYLPMLQSVSVWGVYGLGLVTVLAFTSIALGIKKIPFVASLVFMIALCGLGALRLYNSEIQDVWGIKLRLVQPNIPQTLKWNRQKAKENVSKLIHLSKEKNADITHVIWPESAVPFLLNYHEDERVNLMGAIRQGSFLLTGGMRAVDVVNKTLANSLFVLNDLTDILAYYDKMHLVPFGEYVPLRGILPLDKFVPFSEDIVTGTQGKTIDIEQAKPAGVLICYEVIFSGEVVDKNNRPKWLVNITNDGWYGISSGPYQHLAMAQTRAVEEGLPLVRAAYTGVSAVIDPYGRVLTSLPLGQEGVLDARLPMEIAPTPFALWGNKIPLLLSGLFILLSCKVKFKFRKRKTAANNA